MDYVLTSTGKVRLGGMVKRLSLSRGWAWSALLPGWTPPITIRGGGRQQQALPKMTEKLGICSVGVPWHWAWFHLGVRDSRAGASWQSLVRHPAIFRSTSGQLCASFTSLFSPHTFALINGATVTSQIRKAPYMTKGSPFYLLNLWLFVFCLNSRGRELSRDSSFHWSKVMWLECSLLLWFLNLTPYIFHPLVLALPCEDLQDKLTHFFFFSACSYQIILNFLSSGQMPGNTPAISPSWASRPITSQAYLTWACARSLRPLVLCPTRTVQHRQEVKDVYFFKGPHHGYSLELVGETSAHS